MRLGELLRGRRRALRRTLREVERITGISNGYLSQLESGIVKQPSPSHLHKLASVYDLDYSRLMQLAGHMPVDLVNERSSAAEVVFAHADDLTDEELRKIRAYVQDLRDARRSRVESGREGVERTHQEDHSE